MDAGASLFLEPYLGWMLDGVLMTLLLALASGVLAFPLAAGIAILRGSDRWWRRLAGTACVIVLRNTPPVPLLLLGICLIPRRWNTLADGVLPGGWEVLALILVLAVNLAAYLSECLRSGLRAVPVGQLEAATMLGLGPWTTRWRVTWPQALRVAWPDITTRLVHHLKNTTIAATLPLALTHQELLGQTSRIAGQTFAWQEPLLAAWLIFLLFAGAIVAGARWAGRRAFGTAAVP